MKQAAAFSDRVEKTFTPLPLLKNIVGASATPHVRESCPDPVQGLEWKQDCFQGWEDGSLVSISLTLWPLWAKPIIVKVIFASVEGKKIGWAALLTVRM